MEDEKQREAHSQPRPLSDADLALMRRITRSIDVSVCRNQGVARPAQA